MSENQYCPKCGCGCDTYTCEICAACDRGEYDDPAHTRHSFESVGASLEAGAPTENDVKFKEGL